MKLKRHAVGYSFLGLTINKIFKDTIGNKLTQYKQNG
jgi:hypothetical protein